MKNFLILGIFGVLAWIGYDELMDRRTKSDEHELTNRRTKPDEHELTSRRTKPDYDERMDRSTEPDVDYLADPSAYLEEETPAAVPSRFSCDGRTRCPEMTSCKEAIYFIQNCPGTEMDGDGDGVPCERQWCG